MDLLVVKLLVQVEVVLMSYVPKNNHKKFLNYLNKKKLNVLDWSFHYEGSKVIFNDE